ncbi:MAG TPA: hypothetical protein VF841_13365 [Anaeromyxobacter sp.]
MLVRTVSAGPDPARDPDARPAPARPELLRPDRNAAAAVAPSAPAAARPPDPLSLAGLAACVEDARAAAVATDGGPPDPRSFAALLARLEKAAPRLPPAYRAAVADPLLRTLEDLGESGLARILASDPERVGPAGLVLDVSQAVLQHAEGYEARATAAFQEVVSDLYAGFLSAEDRRGVAPPDRGTLPPLVRWGSAEAGPYTWPVTDTAELDVRAAIVSLPAANARAGLLAWPAVAHETAGHDVLAADDGLRDELAGAVRRRVLAEKMAPALADYWADRIDETAADVLGVLNMGPAAAVGLVGYFRAMNGAARGTATLRNVGRPDDPHPADIARAYLAAETVRLLAFDGASRWADRLVAEADRDLGKIRLGDVPVTAAVARASAAAVARAIVRTRLGALEGHALGEVQGWTNRDEAIVADLRARVRTGGATAGRYAEGTYAAHAVAAAVYEAASGATPPDRAMAGMVGVLAAMNARNEAWAAGRAA